MNARICFVLLCVIFSSCGSGYEVTSVNDTVKKQDLPRIAISVDMLDAGVDIAEVVNLAFMKPINSQIKFWQMIGRGTWPHKTCKYTEWLPNGKKEKYLIVDYWENFDHFNMMPTGDEERTSPIPILVSIINTRLQKLSYFPRDQHADDARRNVQDLRSDIANGLNVSLIML